MWALQACCVIIEIGRATYRGRQPHYHKPLQLHRRRIAARGVILKGFL